MLVGILNRTFDYRFSYNKAHADKLCQKGNHVGLLQSISPANRDDIPRGAKLQISLLECMDVQADLCLCCCTWLKQVFYDQVLIILVFSFHHS